MIIVGTGAVASELTLFFGDTVKGYLEYSSNIDKYYNKYKLTKPILGDVDSYTIRSDDSFVLGFANIGFRKEMANKLISRGGIFQNLIHDSAIVHKDFRFSEGTIIYPQCIVSAKVKIGSFNMLTCQSILSHDVILGSNNVLATTLLCGHVTVGDNNFFGIKSTVVPDRNIGDWNTIQAGQIVDKNVGSHTTVFHRFKENVIYPYKHEEF